MLARAWTKHFLFWLVAALVIFLFWIVSSRVQNDAQRLTFSDFLTQVDRGRIVKVTVFGSEVGREITGRFKNGEGFITFAPPRADGLIDTLRAKDVEISALEGNSLSPLDHLTAWMPMVIMIFFLIFVRRTIQRSSESSRELLPQVMLEKRLELKAKVLHALLSAGRASEAELREQVLGDTETEWLANEFHKALYEMLTDGRAVLTDDQKYELRDGESSTA